MQISKNYASNAIEALRNSAQSGVAKPDGDASSGVSLTPIDQLDLSTEAQQVSSSSSDIRTDKVADIRRQIAAGTYDTDDKLSQAFGRLLDTIG